MYTREQKSKSLPSTVVTFPNREAIADMKSTNERQAINTQQPYDEAKYKNNIFEILVALLLLDEKTTEKHIFSVIAAIILTS